MAFNKEQVYDYIATADSWINLNDALGEINIRELTEPLINSINDAGAVSYILNVPERFRISTTATVLDALSDVSLLPRDAIHQMQDQIYFLRDNFVPITSDDDKINKSQEDHDAWGIDEAPSVWSTSKAIIALMSTHYVQRDDCVSKRRSELRNSVYWLAEQAYPNGGWGYQKYESSPACKPNVPMTALAMKALFLAQQDVVLFNENAKKNSRYHTVIKALNNGKKYLLDCKESTENGDVYWTYNNKAGVAISIWALDALRLLTTDKRYWQFKDEYLELETSVLNFVYGNLPDQSNLETYSQSELFFIAATNEGVKYKPTLKSEKRFYTFVPYIVSSLLDRDEDPFKPKIVTMIRWLLENREKHWAIQEYNVSAPCSISAAMAINVIVKWLKKVSQNSFFPSVTAMISNQQNETHCRYGMPCDKPNPTIQEKIVRTYFFLTSAILALMVILVFIFPSESKLHIAIWILSTICFALLMNFNKFKIFAIKIYNKRKNILWEILFVLIGSAVTWFVGVIFSLIEVIASTPGK